MSDPADRPVVDPSVFDLPWWNPFALVDADLAVAGLGVGVAAVVFAATARFLGRLQGRAGLLASLGVVVAVLAVLEMRGAYREGPIVGEEVERTYAVQEVGEIDVRTLARGGTAETTVVLDDDVPVPIGITADTASGELEVRVRRAGVVLPCTDGTPASPDGRC